MKTGELFPINPKVKLKDCELEVSFTIRSEIQLECDYETPQDVMNIVLNADKGMRITDLVNLLFAGLINSKQFADKDKLVDVMDPKQRTQYADAVIAAYLNYRLTPEQIEKLEVMTQTLKKKTAELTARANMPSVASEE